MSDINKLSMKPNESSLQALLESDDGTAYLIPLYQRDFTWGEEQVGDFLQDALESFLTSKQRFFGTILLSENAPHHDKKRYTPSLYVIDGQQRLTTTLLMLVAMRHLAIEMEAAGSTATQLATRLNDRITIQGEGAAREPRLFANRTNASFLHELLTGTTTSQEQVKESFDKIKPKSDQRRCRALFEAYQTCYKTLQKWVIKKVKGVSADEDSTITLSDFLRTPAEMKDAVDTLEKFRMHFLRHSILVKIQINDWMESFDLFDGLNNRGMELAKKDVLKNVILSRASKSGFTATQEIEKRWQDFDDCTQEFDFTRFLRHRLLLEHAEVSLAGATRMFIRLTHDEGAKKSVDRLFEAALAYSDIISPESDRISDEERYLYDDLNRLSAERVRPIMLASLLKELPAKNRCEILRALECLQFRRSAICQQDNKSLEDTVQKIAALIFTNGPSYTKQAVASIKSLIPADEVFVSNYEVKSAIPDTISRYMLLKIENHLRQVQRQPAIDFKDVTLEHIIPKKSKALWGLDPSTPENKDLIGRLGNLTLLRGPINSGVGNLCFADKKKLYGSKHHTLFISKDIISKTNWTKIEISERQEWLAKHAAKIWKV